MEFGFTPAQEKLRAAVREFAQKYIKPKLEWMFQNQQFDPLIVNHIKRNYVKLWYPREYGGAGGSMLDVCIVMEEIAKVCSTCGLIMEGGGLGGLVIYHGGTEQQKREYIPKLCSGDEWFAFAMTDRGPGSDPVAMETRALKSNGKYIITGLKRLISNCDIATKIVVFAKTDPAKGARGISAFLVEKDAPGLSLKRLHGWGGVEHRVYLLEFQNCEVPAQNLIGQEGTGFIAAARTLDKTRIGLAALGVGRAQAMFELALEYARQRVVFGRPIAEYQAIRFPLAELATKIEAARWLTYRAAWLADAGVRHSRESSMARLFSVETAGEAAELLLRIYGGYGWSKDYPVGKLFLDAKMAQFGQGSLEIQKEIIARSFLGKPGSS